MQVPFAYSVSRGEYLHGAGGGGAAGGVHSPDPGAARRDGADARAFELLMPRPKYGGPSVWG